MAVIVLSVLGAAIVLWKPRWAFVLVVMLFPIKQLVLNYVPALRGSLGWTPNVAIALAAVFALGIRFARGERPLRPYWNSSTVLVLSLYAMAMVALLYSPSRENAIMLLKEGLPYQILLLGFVPMLVDDTADFRRMVTGLLLAGLVVSILVLANPSAVTQSGRTVIEVGVQRSQAGRGRGNPLAMADLGGILAVAAALIKFQRVSLPLNLLRAAAFLCGLGLAIQSGSRGQVIASVAVCVAFFPFARQVRSFKQAAVALTGLLMLAGTIYLTFSLFLGRDGARWSARLWSEGLEGRLSSILTLLEAWANDPLAWVIGLGTNAFSHYAGGWYVHNVAVEALAELGIIGFLIYSGAALVTALSARRLWLQYRLEPELRSAAAVLAGIAAFTTLNSLKQGSIIGMPDCFHWWLIIGYLWKRERLKMADAGRAAAFAEAPDDSVEHAVEAAAYAEPDPSYAA